MAIPQCGDPGRKNSERSEQHSGKFNALLTPLSGTIQINERHTSAKSPSLLAWNDMLPLRGEAAQISVKGILA